MSVSKIENKTIGKTHSKNPRHELEYLEKMERIGWLSGMNQDADREVFKELIADVYNDLKKFRLGLYLAGIDIGYVRVQWLGAMGLINARITNTVAASHLNLVQTNYVNKFYLKANNELYGVVENDNAIHDASIIDENTGFSVNDFILAKEKVTKFDVEKIEINRDAWKIEDVFKIPDDIYDMVTVINKGWQYFERSNVEWKRFNTYRHQAYSWLNANYQMDGNWPTDMKLNFLRQERERCLTNSLYLANKYLWMKDADDVFKGEAKFKAWPAQEVVLFMIDLGFSLIIGKLRQIGFSTVIGGTMALRTMLSKNFYVKMIAQKSDKSEELFEHKVKYAISKCDDYMKPSIPNWSTDLVKFGYSSGKGKEASSESIFEVCSPTEDAINAGTPKITLLDEIGFMKLFGAIVSQGRSTMFKNVNGEMKMVKQVIAWGTGGKTGGAGAPMEVEWKAAKEAWATRNFRHGLVPLFLNYYAKPGHTDEFYMAEKAFYYSRKKKPGEEDPKIIFHQSMPITEDDMFLESSDTVISIAAINMHIDRINKKIADGKLKHLRGYFEPIYDMAKKRGEDAYVPYEIIGARFVPADQSLVEEDSPFACVTMYERPDLTWTNIYYKGSDPIFTSSGHSKFASSIWNAKTKRIAAEFNYKSEDYRYEYLQSLLLNIYYSRVYGGRKTGIRELLEFNVGGEYYNFCCELGYGSIFTGNAMLPQTLQTTTIDIGINKRGTNSVAIVNRLEEMLIDSAANIDSLEFWVQLKTFIRKQISSGYKYEPANKKIHYDDVIDATTYGKINAEVHSHLPMQKVDDTQLEAGENRKRRYYYDANHNIVLGTVAQARASMGARQ
jgi:hypothetical protein